MNIAKIVVASMFLTLIFGYGWCEEEVFIYEDKGRQDPFIPLVGEGSEFLFRQEVITEEVEEVVEEIYLEGVVWDPDSISLAIIDGEVVEEGDLIDGFEIKEIRQTEVVLIKDGKERIINLIEEAEEDVREGGPFE